MHAHDRTYYMFETICCDIPALQTTAIKSQSCGGATTCKAAACRASISSNAAWAGGWQPRELPAGLPAAPPSIPLAEWQIHADQGLWDEKPAWWTAPWPPPHPDTVRAPKEDSPTHGDIEGNSSNHQGLSDSEASSISETGSTVDAADCDSDMEELRESYSSLQALTAEMREPGASFNQRDPRRPQNEGWEFWESRQGLTRFLFLLPTWPLARISYVAPLQVCGQTSGNVVAELLF